MKIQFSKGTVPKQAHVAIPEGLYEEEHGRQGFFGPVTQFYHTHPPTDWKRIEGPLQPRRSTPTTSSRVIARIHAASRQKCSTTTMSLCLSRAGPNRCRFVSVMVMVMKSTLSTEAAVCYKAISDR